MASISYSVDGVRPTTVTGESTQITPVPTGITTYTVTATDLVGNVSNPTTITTHVDGTTPSTSVTFPANGGTYNASGWTNGGTSPCGAAGHHLRPGHRHRRRWHPGGECHHPHHHEPGRD